jgi:hypothetical protein
VRLGLGVREVPLVCNLPLVINCLIVQTVLAAGGAGWRPLDCRAGVVLAVTLAASDADLAVDFVIAGCALLLLLVCGALVTGASACSTMNTYSTVLSGFAQVTSRAAY